MINQDAVDNIDRLVTSAVSGGATAITGGAPLDGPGFFYPPTVLTNVPADADVAVEEILGRLRRSSRLPRRPRWASSVTSIHRTSSEDCE
jgi:hypothetical protein